MNFLGAEMTKLSAALLVHNTMVISLDSLPLGPART